MKDKKKKISVSHGPRAVRRVDGKNQPPRPSAGDASGHALPNGRLDGVEGGRVAVHPGEFLREEFMRPLGLTPQEIAKYIPRDPEFPEDDIARRIAEFTLADEEAVLDIGFSLVLDRFFGLSAGYFWRVQAAHEIRENLARKKAWLRRVKLYSSMKRLN